MARRPEPGEFDKPLTKEELAHVERQLSMLTPYDVQQRYKEKHELCRMDGDRLPKAGAVQELVAAWKQLWKWRKRRTLGRG